MIGRFLITLCSLFALLAEPPVGGGCIQKLAPDGTWAEYQVEIKLGGQGLNSSWLIRSVGQLTHNGQPCRWIEMQQSSKYPGFKNLTWRCLVPESEFGEGKFPLGKAVKVWQKAEGEEAQSVESILSKDALFGALMKGPDKALKTEDTAEFVKWQGGNYECQVHSGDSEATLRGEDAIIHHHVYRHADAPFQLGGLLWEVDVAGQTVTIKMTLEKQGTDAKAQYPDLGI